MRLVLLYSLFLFSIIGYTQVEEVNPPDFIKTITFASNTPQSQLPILRLGEPLRLQFDALTGNEEDFYYKIEHFNYDWTPSSLAKGEYLRGLDNQRIRNYLNSLNTYQIYSHYDLRIPNENTRALLKSGNYLISVYDNYGELMFSRKFMIYEDLTSVGAAVKRTRSLETINEKQTFQITINSGETILNNPLETVKTMIIQNNNLSTAITDLKPQYTLGNQLIYRYDQESAFWGGNEYLFFENKDVRAATVAIQFIDLLDVYHNYLFANINRSKRPYTYYPDINGNFQVNVIDRDNANIEADYTVIHFTLKHDELKGKNVYVYGNYNNYALDEFNLMAYNYEKRAYEAQILLKQGFYNYKYVVVDGKGDMDEGAISGNFWQTENNYKILVYYRDLGARFDRIIGLGEANSENITN
ncbi:DUF5103 domain-containing protein [Winogradskyella sp. A3E31]|uniref:type IX secretion system plug protein n=1 Tax=Winogradskyella sp. A3E31 TaxID=3349637 RepID=UPI00398B50EA